MPRVPVHDLETAPADSRDHLKQLEERYGTILNIHGEMAHAPAVIDLYTNAEAAIGRSSSLDRRTRKAIHLAVAEVNDCDYCRSAYTGAAKAVGLDEDQCLAIRHGTVDFDNALAALLDVAREIAANRGYVTDETWRAATDEGWTDTQILEAFADVVSGGRRSPFRPVALSRPELLESAGPVALLEVTVEGFPIDVA